MLNASTPEYAPMLECQAAGGRVSEVEMPFPINYKNIPFTSVV